MERDGRTSRGQLTDNCACHFHEVAEHHVPTPASHARAVVDAKAHIGLRASWPEWAVHWDDDPAPAGLAPVLITR